MIIITWVDAATRKSVGQHLAAEVLSESQVDALAGRPDRRRPA
jgi:hypothetical protein